MRATLRSCFISQTINLLLIGSPSVGIYRQNKYPASSSQYITCGLRVRVSYGRPLLRVSYGRPLQQTKMHSQKCIDILIRSKLLLHRTESNQVGWTGIVDYILPLWIWRRRVTAQCYTCLFKIYPTMFNTAYLSVCRIATSAILSCIDIMKDIYNRLGSRKTRHHRDFSWSGIDQTRGQMSGN